ncbi:MAG TPA: AraC family transcriptional regulator [Flavipsychrobacter sp.]|nr:AraC family transcriptional regulator [Flavipsychrobacter sp.]
MTTIYPQYGFTQEDVNDIIVRYVRLDNPQSYPFDSYHSHEYNELLYFSLGGGIHSINFTEHPIKSHSMHLLNAGDLHWVERSMSSAGFAIVYKDAFLYKLQEVNGGVDYIDFFSRSEVINLADEEVSRFSFLLDEIAANSENHLYIFNLIGAFFTKLILENDAANTSTRKQVNETAKQFFDLVQQHYAKRYRLNDYAAILHLSSAVLDRKVREATGKTVNMVQQEFLLKEAKRLLIQTDLPLKDIADKLGFNELSHFSNWFKKETNIQPGHYRK